MSDLMSHYFADCERDRITPVRTADLSIGRHN